MNPAPDRQPPDYGRLAAVGPYFALDTSPAGEPPEGFRPLPELYGTGPDAPLAARLRVVAQRLGTAEPRVAASILHLGLAARFWSVGLGSAVLLGSVPTLEHAWVRIPDQGPLDLWTPLPPLTAPNPLTPPHSPEPVHPTPGPLADQLHRAVLLGQLEPLAAAVRAVVPLSPRLLLGNAASALAGTLRVLDAHAPGAARALVAELLERPPLAGSGTLRSGPRGTAFRRTSCCLYYRVGPGTGLCGDCCFAEPPARGKRTH
ncbi:ferric iron reductase FhuF-like transporter [Streptomyces sp. 1114.5]|uniref:(2Fe-2S)-binding protein n=1 Tax=Streptomyces sp. 1114.5 TaxID=1938830 RepID=UPI000EAC4370|nr:(2Fe-2S)-binding protein [Streptomyces sp. 1114.5]RKT12015.1 ferric iron reductase FhuF-like transporter [Streptomyces sp. 1114.5]